jgi:hypothetical protein
MGVCPVFTGSSRECSRKLSDFDVIYFPQSLPIIFGVPIAGYLNVTYGGQIGYYLCAACSIVGSLTLFLINVHKRNVSRHKEGKAGDA